MLSSSSLKFTESMSSFSSLIIEDLELEALDAGEALMRVFWIKFGKYGFAGTLKKLFELLATFP